MAEISIPRFFAMSPATQPTTDPLKQTKMTFAIFNGHRPPVTSLPATMSMKMAAGIATISPTTGAIKIAAMRDGPGNLDRGIGGVSA